ncbi:MAG: monofunctional biosynthetic peptidoglycan transglycosylase [Pseudomonadota bacterium]|jgi:monofunctional biosynthetic peptidoglycan transglycosylase
MLKTLWRWSWRAFLLVLIALTAVQFWFLVHVWYWAGNNPESTAFMRARLEILQEDNPKARLRQQWVPYQRISGHLKRAIIAAEDAKFVSHNGFDWDGIQKAYEKNMREGEIVAGGSTITQQLAKNLFFSGERTWWRKAQEAVVAVMIETVMSKRRILEIYLNVIEWGEGVFGAEAAARLHYGTTAAGLSAEQAARLASIVPSPRRYGPASDTAYLQRRTQTILARMNGSQIP